ncbi:uncharacterized protein LOC111907049 [Lactuca sativa]|uniref:uncharacterized protein LOC111907049 n=1 Tax=Lactuca sativa TaxID=4236 RepID=UPI000CD92008|nr:uncharacterized protein LOC111907049 [Lactuca sativa]
MERFANGLPADVGPMVKMPTTLKEAVRAAKNVETQIRENGLEKVEDGEKRKLEGSLRSDKNSKSSKFKDHKPGSDTTRWCGKCKKKHFRECIEGVTCYKCRKTGHYANECMTKKEVCFKFGEEGHFKKDCPKKEGTARLNTPPKTRGRTYFMGLDETIRG